jgi:hypothetical protein
LSSSEDNCISDQDLLFNFFRVAEQRTLLIFDNLGVLGPFVLYTYSNIAQRPFGSHQRAGSRLKISSLTYPPFQPSPSLPPYEVHSALSVLTGQNHIYLR